MAFVNFVLALSLHLFFLFLFSVFAGLVVLSSGRPLRLQADLFVPVGSRPSERQAELWPWSSMQIQITDRGMGWKRETEGTRQTLSLLVCLGTSTWGIEV